MIIAAHSARSCSSLWKGVWWHRFGCWGLTMATMSMCSCEHTELIVIDSGEYMDQFTPIVDAISKTADELGFEPTIEAEKRLGVATSHDWISLEFLGSCPETFRHWFFVTLDPVAVPTQCSIDVSGDLGDNALQSCWLYTTQFPRKSTKSEVKTMFNAIVQAAKPQSARSGSSQ